MAAGESARDEARRSAELAQRHREKAERSARRAASFAAGAVGEEALDAELSRLVRRGWTPIPDRRSPWGGNMDELLVGPRGVAVMDSKAWSQPVRVEPDRLYAADRRRTQAVNGVLRQVRAVEEALATSGHGGVAVQGFIALTGRDRAHPPVQVRDVWVIGLDHVEQGFAALPRTLSGQTVAEVAAVLEASFPPCCPPINAPQSPRPVSPLFEWDIRLLYIRPGRNRRLYVKAPDGTDLGSMDPRSGAITCLGDDEGLVRAVLNGASFAGIRASSEDLPRIPTSVNERRAGSPAWVSVLVGMEWFSRGGHRLYGTLLVPDVGSFLLGHVGLENGRRFPSVVGSLAPNLDSADEYLRVLWARWPGQRRPSPPGRQAS